MKPTRTWTVVGHLCRSDAEARKRMLDYRAKDPNPKNDWGLVRIKVARGDKPSEIGKIRVPPSPALLKRLEGVLSKPEVRRTAAGREAIRLVREALKQRR